MATVMADLPLHERPRERLLHCGVEALSERELLALIVRHGTAGESALDLATSLLIGCGGLSPLACAGVEELSQRSGVGPTTASAIVAAFRIGRMADVRPVPRTLRGPQDVANAVSSELARLRRERVVIVICDARNHVIRTVAVAEGSTDRAPFPIREILNAVLRRDGRAFAVAHNHPSGDPTPSDADRRTTDELARAAKIVGLRFLDHVVIADQRWQSIANRNWQRQY
jgi:DNA repair protein RadC